MNPVTCAVDKFKEFSKSSENFFKGIVQRVQKPNQRNPVELLKRLQREAFSDLMKLRDRQEKIERLISFYKSSGGGPFSETKMKGEIDVSGAVLLLDSTGDLTSDALSMTGMSTGVHSKFIFETVIREKDALVAEFAVRKLSGVQMDAFGGPLVLSKLMYSANVNDWVSITAVPVGGECRDITSCTLSQRVISLTDFYTFGPPFFDQHHGSAAGLVLKGSNYSASLGGLFSWLPIQPNNFKSYLSTLGQFTYNLSLGTKLTLMGLHQTQRSQGQQVGLGSLTIPFSGLKFYVNPTRPLGEITPLSSEVNLVGNTSNRSIALVVESEIDESSRIGAWVELKKSDKNFLQWCFSLSDTPEDEMGWGVNVRGVGQGSSAFNHFQMEAFLRFNLSKKFSLQPGFVYAMHEKTRISALMLRSSWLL